MVEPEVAAMAAKNAPDADVIDIHQLALDMALAYQTGREHTQYDIDFHVRTAEATGNSVAPRIISLLSTAISVMTVVTEKKFMDATIKNHENVVKAIRDHQPNKAKRAMMKPIEFTLTNIRSL